MKKVVFGSLFIFAITIMSFVKVDGLKIGDSLPLQDLKLKEIVGKSITLSAAKNTNGLLVMFSCNTCPFVIKNQTRTIEVCNYAKKNNIGVIILNSNESQRNDADSYDAMKKYAKEQNYNCYYAVDENSVIADAFGANRTPESFLFDKDLKLVYHGAIDDNPNDANNVTRKHIQVAIDEIISGKAVTLTTSRSVGCTIKRKS